MNHSFQAKSPGLFFSFVLCATFCFGDCSPCSGFAPDSQQQPGLQQKPWQTEGPEAVPSMLGYAQMLNLRRGQANQQQLGADYQALLEISNDLSKLTLDENQKSVPFHMRGQALQGLSSLGHADARKQLEQFTAANLNHEDMVIRKSAYFLNLSTAMGDLARSQSPDGAEVVGQVNAMLGAFPGDIEVARQLYPAAEQMAGGGQSGPARQMLLAIATAADGNEDEAWNQLGASLRDRIYLDEIGYIQMFRAVQSDPAADRAAFVQVVQNIASREGIGRDGYFTVVSAARWMESLGMQSEAGATYTALETATRNNPDPMIVDAAVSDKEMAMRRMNTKGTKIVIAGQNDNGEEFALTQIQNKKVVGLFFWSASEPRSVGAMQAMLNIWSRYKDMGFELVAVCVDQDVATAKSLFTNQSPPWVSLFQATEEHRQLHGQLGVQSVPYMVLMDDQQNVTHIHMSLQSAGQVLTGLLGAPSVSGGESAPGSTPGG